MFPQMFNPLSQLPNEQAKCRDRDDGDKNPKPHHRNDPRVPTIVHMHEDVQLQEHLNDRQDDQKSASGPNWHQLSVDCPECDERE